jgi:hypothetical protein
MSAVSSGQIAAIHALKGRAGLDDGGYRDVLAQVAGVGTSKALTHAQAGLVIERLKRLSGEARGRYDPLQDRTGRHGALALTGSYAPICRALWISAWNLGLVERREDTALFVFVRRQTGLDHLNWLRSADEAAKVIEALKGWMTREAGVTWPPRAADNGAARKLAVIVAQCRVLGETGAMREGDLDATMNDLGRRIRQAKAR